MYNKFIPTHINKSNSGFSLVEAIFAIAILTVSGYITAQLYTATHKQSKNISVKENAPFLHDQIQNRLQSTVLSKKESSSNSKLCDYLNFEPVEYGTTEVFMKVSKKSLTELYDNSLFDRFYKGFGKVVSSENCKDSSSATIKKCIQLIDDKDQNGDEIYASVTANFMKIDPIQNTLFNAINDQDQQIDAKKVVIEMNSKLIAKNHSILGERKQIAWLAELGTCKINGQDIEISATGPGDPNGERIYNNTDFSEDRGQNPFEINFQRLSVQEGLVLDDGSLVADPSKNVAVACTERTYRCPNSSRRRDFDSNINIRASVNYTGNKKIKYPRVTPSLKFKFKNGSRTFSKEKKDVSIYTGGRNYIYSPSRGGYYAEKNVKGKTEVDSSRPLRLEKGSHSLSLTVKAVDNVCHSVCSNTESDFFTQLVLGIKELGSFKQSYNPGSAMSCTVCNMKNCSQLGLGTFGPAKKQPIEPLDGQLPECALENKSDLEETNPLRSISSVNNVSGKCIAARVNTSGNGLTLESRNCSEQLPVLCFNYGNFYVSYENSARKNILTKSSFPDASRTCFNMSKEVVSRAKLKAMFSQYSNLSTTNVDRLISSSPSYSDASIPSSLSGQSLISFYNNAFQGAFLAPQTSAQVKDMVANIRTKQPQVGKNFFWINLQKGNKNEVYAPPHFHSVGNSGNENFALYFDETGIPYVNEDQSRVSSSFDVSSSGEAAILAHGLKHRGVFFSKNKQEQKLPYVCQSNRSKNFFISRSKSNDARKGHSTCSKEGGSFIPPRTPLLWSQVMQLLNPHDPLLAFANPSRGGSNFAWVSLQGSKSSHDWIMPDDWKKALSAKFTSDEFMFNSDFKVLYKKPVYNKKGKKIGSSYPSKGIDVFYACINEGEQTVKIVKSSKSCGKSFIKMDHSFISSPYYLSLIYRESQQMGLRSDDYIRVD